MHVISTTTTEKYKTNWVKNGWNIVKSGRKKELGTVINARMSGEKYYSGEKIGE